MQVLWDGYGDDELADFLDRATGLNGWGVVELFENQRSRRFYRSGNIEVHIVNRKTRHWWVCDNGGRARRKARKKKVVPRVIFKQAPLELEDKEYRQRAEPVMGVIRQLTDMHFASLQGVEWLLSEYPDTPIELVGEEEAVFLICQLGRLRYILGYAYWV